MELWTEYEGRTIEGAFSLNKLLLPEGRSAFFSTSNGKGVPTVIRLIASHFDEEEILARWRGVESFGHPNILKIEQYGQLVLDDTTVVYAVFEPVDASLAEVVRGQRLTITEARQLASSIASAIEALHTHGFVHEHVDPANVFAVGEVVKLRGDCIRETPEGERGTEAKRQDIHDLASVLLRALTQSETLEEATRVRPLPAPFDEIVRNGLSGAWGLAQITSALDSSGPVAAVAAILPASPATEERKKVSEITALPASEPIVPDTMQARGRFVPPTAKPVFAVEDWRRSSLPPVKWLAAGGLAILLIFWLIWHVAHGRPANQSAAARVSEQGAPAPVEGTRVKPVAAVSSVAAQRSLTAQQNAGVGLREWRVVAFTYNHTDQAQKKVKSIAQSHAGMRPEVFTPTGHAPYLVTIGGVMTRDQAFAFAQGARNQGLPRDTYAQNYRGTGR